MKAIVKFQHGNFKTYQQVRCSESTTDDEVIKKAKELILSIYDVQELIDKCDVRVVRVGRV